MLFFFIIIAALHCTAPLIGHDEFVDLFKSSHLDDAIRQVLRTERWNNHFESQESAMRLVFDSLNGGSIRLFESKLKENGWTVMISTEIIKNTLETAYHNDVYGGGEFCPLYRTKFGEVCFIGHFCRALFKALQ